MKHFKIDRPWFWIIAIALHALFFGKQLFFGTTLLQDSKEYLFAAENLIQHHTLYAWDLNQPYNAIWLTKRPILYPLILSLFKLLSCGNNGVFLFFLLLAQNLASLFSLKLAETILKKYAELKDYKYVLFFLLLTPAQAIYANLIMSEIWLELVLILILHFLLVQKDNTQKILWLSGLCILAMSLKPVMILMAFCLPLYCLWKFKFWEILQPLLVGLLPIVFLSSVTLINGERTGYAHYSSITNINLLKYNAYTLLMHEKGTTYADSVIDAIQSKAALQPSFRVEQQFTKMEGQRIVMAHWSAYVYLHIRGMLFCFLDPGRFDITQFFGLEHRSNLLYETNKKNNFKAILSVFMNPAGVFLLLVFVANIIKGLLVLKFIFSKTISSGFKIILLFIPAYIVFLTGPIGSSRFAMPFFPILMIILLISLSKQKSKVL